MKLIELGRQLLKWFRVLTFTERGWSIGLVVPS